MAAGVEAAPDIINARGVPTDPTPDPDYFDRKDCSRTLFEIGFWSNLGLQDIRANRTEKYHPLLCALRRSRDRVGLVYIPIGYAGTTLRDTGTDIAAAFAKARPSTEAKG
jgi:hypothetical protein